MNAREKQRIVEAQRLEWRGLVAWVVSLALLGGCMAAAHWSVRTERWWLAALLVIGIACLMHGQLMAFHEAAHSTLAPIRWLNDAVGIFVGTFSFMGLTVYRAMHRTHHLHLATARDEELWPFVLPGFPLRLRRLALGAQIFLGLAYMPALALRSFLRAASPMKNRAERRRAAAEYALMAAVWAGILAAMAWISGWKYFLVDYVAPALLAGNIQGLRGAIEHVGLIGRTKLASTRSIVPASAAGRLLALLWFNIEYHGAHHRFPRIPQTRLPGETWLLEPTAPGEAPPYPSYSSALGEAWRSFSDPRIGAQWLAAPSLSGTGAVGAEAR